MSLFRRASAKCPACGHAARRDVGERSANGKPRKVELKCPACKTTWQAQLDGAWWVLWRELGGKLKRYRVGPDKASAHAVEGKLLAAVREGRVLSPKPKCTTNLGELAEAFGDAFEAEHKAKPGNVANYRSYLAAAVRLIGAGTMLDRIDGPAVEAFRLASLAEGKAPATAARRLGVLRSALSWAVRHGKLDSRPTISAPAVDNARAVHLTPAEAARLVEACEPEGPWLGQIVRWALATGCRRAEVLGLRWAWLDLERGLLSIPAEATKTLRGRTLPLNRTMRAVLAEREAERVEGLDLVFTLNRREISGQRALRAFQRAVAAAGLPPMRFHDLRHVAAGRMAEQGVDLYRLATVLGHAGLGQVRRYAALMPDHLRDALEATEVDPTCQTPAIVPPALPGVIQFPKRRAASNG